MAGVLLRSAVRMPGATSFTRQSAHQYSTSAFSVRGTIRGGLFLAGALFIGALADERAEAETVDYTKVRQDIAAILDKQGYDDGSYGPVLVRLAWHASGTYDKTTCTGGSDGATMRFCPEMHHGANAGLQVARDLLEPLKAKYPAISYADLWTLAGVVAIEEAGGPRVAWRPGRSDKPAGSYCPPDGRLPDASKGADHIRDVFGRMGFDDREMVALIGAHAMGRCHTDRSGFDGPWTKAPTVFSNSFFTELFDQDWSIREWSGPHQFRDASGELMMLPTDLALRDDPAFNKWAKLYAEDEEQFFNDFSTAFAKLLELGAKNLRPYSAPPSRKN